MPNRGRRPHNASLQRIYSLRGLGPTTCICLSWAVALHRVNAWVSRAYPWVIRVILHTLGPANHTGTRPEQDPPTVMPTLFGPWMVITIPKALHLRTGRVMGWLEALAWTPSSSSCGCVRCSNVITTKP